MRGFTTNLFLLRTQKHSVLLLFRKSKRKARPEEILMTASPPRPGRPVLGSTTGRPVMAALDLFGRRWTLRVLWELRDGAVGFRLLQQRKLMDRELRRRVRRFPPGGSMTICPPGQRERDVGWGGGSGGSGSPAGCRSR
jgi:hypothetical protein